MIEQTVLDWLAGVAENPWALIGYAAAAVFAIQRGVDVLERAARVLEAAGRAPARVRGWLERRAQRIVTAEREREALQQLLANSDLILAQFSNNGGSTFADAVTERFDDVSNRLDMLTEKLNAHLDEQPPILAEHRDMLARVARLEQGGVTQSPPPTE